MKFKELTSLAIITCFSTPLLGGLVDSKLPSYSKVFGVSGTLNAVGSDTLNNMMALWAESFQAVYPNVKIQIEGKRLLHRPSFSHPGYFPVRTYESCNEGL